MTKTELTRFPGVYKRSDSNTYQFGLRVPKDLNKQLPSAWAVRCSLHTAELREANAKAKALHADWAARFETLRSGKALPIPPVPQVDLAALRAKMLTHAEHRYLPGVDRRSAAMTPEEREKEAASLGWSRQFLLQGLKDGHDLSGYVDGWLSAVLDKDRSPAAVAEAIAFYVTLLELQAESVTDHTRAYPKRVEWLTARRALAGVGTGSSVIGSPVPQHSSARKGHKIADALRVWSETPRPDKTLAAFRRHVNMFTAMMDDPILSSIVKVDAIRFRDKLQQWAVDNYKTAATADNVMVSIKTLTNVARDQGWVEVNPFERLAVKVGGKESEGREPWRQEELVVLFDDPIWTEYRLPAAAKAGADAAYWIPLIACYTGARVTEIAQLWTDDLTTSPGAEVIEFRANKERGQILKNKGSWRAVPMHSELVRLGLTEYVASLPLGPLFPKLPTAGQNGAGGQFSKWFGDFKRGKGFGSTQKAFHSFRHLVASELRLAGVAEALADAITGHTGGGVARNVYAATIRRDAERLRPTVEALCYPGFSLRRINP